MRNATTHVIALLVSILWMADSSLADEFVVNTTLDTVDTNPGDGICADASGACSLRAAVMESNANGPSQDFIFLPPGTYVLTLPFSLGDDGGDLVITDSVTIIGAGNGVTFIDGNDSTGVFRTAQNPSTSVHIQLRDLTIQNGDAQGGGGIYLVDAYLLGLGIVVRDCFAFSQGGGILCGRARIHLIDSTIDNGNTFARGGGMDIVQESTVRLDRCLIVGNTANQGGGIRSINSRLEIYDSTITGNTSNFRGGGVLHNGTLWLSGVTITDNSALEGDGGGVRVIPGGLAFVWNSIIAGNTATTVGNDCSGTMKSYNHNLIGTGDGLTLTDSLVDLVGTDLSPIDPRLGPLDWHGGATRTHSLLPGSVAIDAGSSAAPGSSIFACEDIDQRGHARAADGDGDGGERCDIGAYERLAVDEEPGFVTCWGYSCPCDNNDFSGAGCRNSTGQGARLLGDGTARVNTDDMVLTCSQLPPNTRGVFFMGTFRQLSPLSFGDGNLCAKPGPTGGDIPGGYYRFKPVLTATPSGEMVLGPGVAGMAPAFIQEGTTFVFQCWYRDLGGPCGSGFNLSNGYLVSFTP